MSLRDKFLQRASDFSLVPFEADGEVICYIRPMTKGIKSKIEAMISGERTAKVCTDVRWIALSTCMADESGNAILKGEDKTAFESWKDSEIEPIFEKILEVGKVSETDKDEFLKK